ncbi:DnaJ domain-containing protein [Ruania suaedae]|uniref:DnaJ C-terminal domain-containing protein n=1 Tax=Ruania suaedae TaxID=2897774 RepID=UPI001E49CE45|nr:DnaJ C-terminal domain-containing protein [Ruania suaedae]UFU02722.1 DnaJ domain-containing protein [Ruania suaedae]
MTGQDWLEKDFYATLGVPKDADAAAIKKAYRKLARTWHPDQNPGDAQAEQKFKEIGEAYGVLSDPEQRKQYDGLRAMAGGGPRFASGPGGAGAAGAAGFEDLFGGMFTGAGGGSRVRYSSPGGGMPGGGFEDILGGLFGGGMPGTGPTGSAGFQRSAPAKGGDITTSASLPFRSAVEGATVSLTLERSRSMTVRIPAGVRDGQKIRLAGKGQPSPSGGPAGDLIVTVHVEPHPVFAMKGKNLTITVPITFPEAVNGATIAVPTLSGEQVRLKVPAGTQSGSRLRAKGRGVPGKNGDGDLIVTVEVAVPRNLSKDAAEALEAFAAASDGTDPRAHLAAAAKG